ncbi:LORF2 protein, partial [Crocuta crocuta]
HLTHIRVDISKKKDNNKYWQRCGEIGAFIECWWECKLGQLLWKTAWQFFRKFSLEFPYDPAFPIAKIYLFLMHKVTCTPIFIAALSTIAKTWKEPKCPSIDQSIKKMCYIYTMEYYMTMRKNEIWPWVATWMDLEGVMLSELSQAEKFRYHMLACIGGL